MKRTFVFVVLFAMLGLQLAFAQTKQITGTVTSADDGLGIPGVSVVIKGTTLGTTTDIDGKYSLSVSGNDAIVVYSFVGLKTIEMPATQSVINVVMQSDSQELEEVMVVAYGVAKKESFTGSASVVKADKIEKLQVSSVSNALQGASAGMQVISSSGQPGENATIRIRGIGSLSASAAPLYVVDGAPYAGALNSINPSDIESITVLKDASAASLYGSRAANGVVIITTKRAKKGDDFKINVKLTQGYSTRAVKDYELLDAGQYMRMYWEGIANSYNGAVASDNLIALLKSNPYGSDYPNPIDADGNVVDGAKLLWDNDWRDALTQTAKRTEFVGSVAGGSDKTQLYFSGGYLNEEGYALASKFERYSARLAANANPKKWLKIGTTMNLAHSEQNYPNSSGNAFSNVVMFGRNVSSIYNIYQRDLKTGEYILDADGNRLYDFGENRPYAANSNPVATTKLNEIRYERASVDLNSFAEADIIKGLKFKSIYSVNYMVLSSHEYATPQFGDGKMVNGRSYKDRDQYLIWNFTNTLNYDKTFNEKHHINLLAGMEAYKSKIEELGAGRTGFPFEGLTELSSGAVLSRASSATSNYALLGYLSQVTYDYSGKYYLSASFRRDGSSKFKSDNRWGNFWSVGATWRVSQESFLNDVKWLNDLKLRASYGTSGNDGIPGLFPYMEVFSTGWSNLTYPGLLYGGLANEKLIWESNKVMNVAVEARLFDRLSATIEYYDRRSSDQLFSLPKAPSIGVTSVDANIGEVKNNGVEIELNNRNIVRNDFEWETSFNISFNKNEITSLPQDEILRGNRKWVVGKSAYEWFMPEWAGVNPDNGLPQWWRTIVNAEGNKERVKTSNYNTATKYFLGSALPTAFGGLTNTFRYKNFDFSFLFTYSIGGSILDNDYAAIMHGGRSTGTSMSIDMLDRWQKPGDITDVPKASYKNILSTETSSRFLVDADYLRLRNITIGYKVPERLTRKIGIEDCRVSLIADNLWTLFGHKGLDPEQGVAGTTDNRSSSMKTISAGINFSF